MPGRARSCSSAAAPPVAPTSWITVRPPPVSTSAIARRSASRPRVAGPSSRTTRWVLWRRASLPSGPSTTRTWGSGWGPRGGACATRCPPRVSPAPPAASASTPRATRRPARPGARGGPGPTRPPALRVPAGGGAGGGGGKEGQGGGAVSRMGGGALTVRRVVEALRDLRLNAKVTLTLTAIFGAIVAAFLLFLVPFLREQRADLLEKDKRLLSTLRDNYERDFIYDLLSRNEESLGVHLADLPGPSGLLWVRVEADGIGLAATADRETIRRLLGEEAAAFETEETLALLLHRDGRADLVSTGGRPLLSQRVVSPEALPAWTAAERSQGPFAEARASGQAAPSLTAELQAAE